MQKKKVTKKPPRLSATAELLLRRMALDRRVQYHVAVLGGGFQREDLDTLDQAYLELEGLGLAEPTSAIIPVLGRPRRLYTITPRGERFITRSKAA